MSAVTAEGSGNDWAPVVDGIPAPGNNFVLPEHKIIYVSVTKVACTALRWMTADLAGEDLESFTTALHGHQTRLMTIHRDRTFWKKTPQLYQIPRSERGPISRDNGWLIFAVVRDPWSRLWSAWQSKFLVQHPYYLEHYGEEDWFPRVPTSQADVLEDFATFVFTQPWRTHERLMEDTHFLSQTFSVRPRNMNYSRIYDLTELPELFADIHTHLQGIGKDQELFLPRANETPLPLIPAVLENGVAEEIEKLYRDDFDNFGARWSRDALRFKADAWDLGQIEHAAYHATANERIGDISEEARRVRRELIRTRARVQRLEAEVADLRRGNVRVQLGRVRRRIVRVVRR